MSRTSGADSVKAEANHFWPYEWTGPECEANDPESVYAKVAELDTSEIKICIGSSYFLASSSRQAVAVLDALAVKVGPFFEDETSPTKISPLQLILTGAAGKLCLSPVSGRHKMTECGRERHFDKRPPHRSSTNTSTRLAAQF